MKIVSERREKEGEFYQHIEQFAEQAFDDQRTGSNPRYPLIKDLQELYNRAYGEIYSCS